MDFKLFLPLASTLVVGGTFTVFYMGYLKNQEIKNRKINVKINLDKIWPKDEGKSESSVVKE